MYEEVHGNTILFNHNSALSPSAKWNPHQFLGDCFGIQSVEVPSLEAARWFIIIGQWEAVQEVSHSPSLTKQFLQDSV